MPETTPTPRAAVPGAALPHRPAVAAQQRIALDRARGPQIKASPALTRHAGIAVHAARPAAPAVAVRQAAAAKAAVQAPVAAPVKAPAKPSRLAVTLAATRKSMAALPARMAYWRAYSAWWLKNIPYWMRMHRRLMRKVRKWGTISLVAGAAWLYFGPGALTYEQVYPLMIEDDSRGSTLYLKVKAYLPDRHMGYFGIKAWEAGNKQIYVQLQGHRLDPFGLLLNDKGTIQDSTKVEFLKRGVYTVYYADGSGNIKKLKKAEI